MVLPEGLYKGLMAVRQQFHKMGIKEPWLMTGAWSAPDHQHFLWDGTHYRAISPGSQPIKARVPHDPPQLVYDIKYFVRDDRRNNKWLARTVDKKPFDFDKVC